MSSRKRLKLIKGKGHDEGAPATIAQITLIQDVRMVRTAINDMEAVRITKGEVARLRPSR